MFDQKYRSFGDHCFWAVICGLGTYLFVKEAIEVSAWYWIGVPFTAFAMVMNIIKAAKK